MRSRVRFHFVLIDGRSRYCMILVLLLWFESASSVRGGDADRARPTPFDAPLSDCAVLPRSVLPSCVLEDDCVGTRVRARVRTRGRTVDSVRLFI
jgi:hypothetical protein